MSAARASTAKPSHSRRVAFIGSVESLVVIPHPSDRSRVAPAMSIVPGLLSPTPSGSRSSTRRHPSIDAFEWAIFGGLTQLHGCYSLSSNRMVAIYTQEAVMGFPNEIERTVEIAHPPARVWAALTTAEGLGTWFGNAATIDLR